MEGLGKEGRGRGGGKPNVPLPMAQVYRSLKKVGLSSGTWANVCTNNSLCFGLGGENPFSFKKFVKKQVYTEVVACFMLYMYAHISTT